MEAAGQTVARAPLATVTVGDRVDVVLEAEFLPDGSTRIHMIGVFIPGTGPSQRYDRRNVVQTWLGVDHDIYALRVWNGEGE